jgi:mannose/fructose/N-acetylgalactosamine-specific phosphotransferase system component IIC
LTATLPPDKDQLVAADVQYLTGDAGEMEMVIEALTAKRNLVACSKCGLVLGGYGTGLPQVEAEE